MEDSEILLRNRGCYDLPHSGVGMEFFPLSTPAPESGVVLHETGFLPRNDWWMFPNTVSPFWRLYYNASPGHKVIFPRQEIRLEPDHLLMIPDSQIFHSHGRGEVSHFWMTFTLGFVPREPEPVLVPLDPELRHRITRLCGRFEGIGRGDRFAIFHESLALLHDLISRMSPLWQEAPRSPALEKVVAYIQDHLAEPLDIPSLAKLAGFTPRSLSAHFRKEYHCSPARFVSRVRIREVARLLATTEFSIDEIATSAGFADRFYLTRVFTKTVGKSPARFRREYQGA